MKSKEPVERDFKGVWIPKHIYENKHLSWTEKILLVEIGNLDHGEGCFASNQYLADFLHKSESQVANLISKLRKEGFLKNRKFDGRKRHISLTKNRKPALRKTGAIVKEYSKTVAGKTHDKLIPSKKPSNKSFSKSCAQRLEKTIREKRKIFRKVDQKKWAQHFCKLRMEYHLKKSRVTSVLKWYIAHFGEEFVPVAYSAKTFCDKFFQIEDARNRYNKDVDEGRTAPKVVGKRTRMKPITSAHQGYE